LQFFHRLARADETRERVLRGPFAAEGGLCARELLAQGPELVEDRLEVVDAIVEYETDGAVHGAGLILERNAAHDEVLLVELHDVDEYRPARLDDAAHQRMRDDL